MHCTLDGFEIIPPQAIEQGPVNQSGDIGIADLDQ